MPKPTFIPFYSGTRENGMTECVTSDFLRLNVNDYDYWTTLSGVNKNNYTSPDAGDISASLRKCQELFWYFYAVQTTATAQRSDVDSGGEASMSEIPVEGDYAQPRDRVCETSLVNLVRTYPTETPSIISCRGVIGFRLFELYNGDISDYSNLIGYSLGNLGTSIFELESNMNFGRAGVKLYSVADEGSSSSFDYEHEYVSVNGFHFLCQAYATKATSVSSNDIDATVLSAEYDFDNGSTTGYATAQITGLDMFI